MDTARSASEEKYHYINLLMRELGVEAVLRAGCVTPVLPYARPAKFGISQPEVVEVLAQMRDFDDWPAVWERSARRYERLAQGCLSEGSHAPSARDGYLHASYIYHLAQLYCRVADTKRRLHRKSVDTYKAAAEYLKPPVSSMAISFNGLEIPGYLRLPHCDYGTGNTPWILLVDGADTTKEEAHYQAEAFLERNLAVFCFDGPGQGELRYDSKVRLGEFEKAVTAIITVLLERAPALSADKIGIYGISTGGYLALRSACCDHRIKAVVSVGGFIDARGYFDSPITTQDSVRSLFGIESREQMVRFLNDEISIRESLRSLNKPQLIVYGGKDHLVPRTEIDDLMEAIGSWGTLTVFEQGTHALQNVDHVVKPMVADWMAEALTNNRALKFEFIEGLW